MLLDCPAPFHRVIAAHDSDIPRTRASKQTWPARAHGLPHTRRELHSTGRRRPRDTGPREKCLPCPEPGTLASVRSEVAEPFSATEAFSSPTPPSPSGKSGRRIDSFGPSGSARRVPGTRGPLPYKLLPSASEPRQASTQGRRARSGHAPRAPRLFHPLAVPMTRSQARSRGACVYSVETRLKASRRANAPRSLGVA